MEPTSTEITRIHLPSMVDDKLDLAEINQRLREKKGGTRLERRGFRTEQISGNSAKRFRP